MRVTYFWRIASVNLLAVLALVACNGRPVPATFLDSSVQDGPAQADLFPGSDRGGRPAPCNTNAHCDKTDYCHLDQGCVATGGSIGQCKKRPQNCTSLSDPVCGCDGKTHGNACAAHWAGANIAYKGKCQTCSELSTLYTEAVLQAKKCCLPCSKPQCTYKVKNNLICPCYTYIETDNTAALSDMQRALAKWTAQKCKTMDCGMSCGPEPKGGSCGGVTGTCKDTF